MSEYGEPWRIVPEGVSFCGFVGADGKIPFYRGKDLPLDRIIACVNFCAGIPTEALLDATRTGRSQVLQLVLMNQSQR